MQACKDLIQVDLTEDEAQEILKSLPEQSWASLSIKAKLKTLLEKKAHGDTRPHKLADDYETRISCPFRGNWNYCCRCRFGFICNIEENRGNNMNVQMSREE